MAASAQRNSSGRGSPPRRSARDCRAWALDILYEDEHILVRTRPWPNSQESSNIDALYQFGLLFSGAVFSVKTILAKRLKSEHVDMLH